MIKISMLCGFWQNVLDFFTGIFALIPQFLYFIFTCCASLLDFLQFVVRKLAGLDVYYVNGEAVTGDIVSDFISGVLGIGGTQARYSSLSTVFWSMVIFGCILLVLTTIISIIKSQYNYDAKKSNPMTIIGSSIKTLLLMAIIPLTTIFGVYLSNVLLRTADTITSPASSAQIVDVFKNSSGDYSTVFEKGTTSNGQTSYTSYDFFGSSAYTTTSTFSGIMFKVSARDSNRVRYGSYTPTKESTMGNKDFNFADFGIFTSQAEDESLRREEVADMIDYAFANCLTLQNKKQNASLRGKESVALISSFTYLESAVWYFGLINVKCFSKYNVGLVWYYYNLWSFNFFLGYAGMIACLTIFGSVVFGLMARLFRLLALFLVFPPLVGIGPLDGNSAVKKWQKQFIGDILMGIGAIVGVNLAFILLGELQKVYFFKSEILNNVMDWVLILVLLSSIKDLIKFMSGFVGGGDANATGKEVGGAVKKLATNAADKAVKVTKIALKFGLKATPIGQALDKGIKAAEKIKKIANAAKGLSPADLTKLNNAKATLEQESKDAEADQALADADTEDFAKVMENNIGHENSTFADNNVANFVASSGETKADEVYQRYKDDYNTGAAAIDSNASLSAKEKKDQKKELSKQLAVRAVDEFREFNSHAIAAKEHTANATDAEREIKNLEKTRKQNIENEKKAKKESRPRIVNAALDLGGATLKAVGNITGVTGAWKNLKKDSSLPDDFKEVFQTFFQEMDMDTAMDKVKEGKSKLTTQKQKDKLEEKKQEDYERAVLEQRTQSELYQKEILELARQIKKAKSEGRM